MTVSYWRLLDGPAQEIYGTGGADFTAQYNTCSLNDGDACETDI
jgi:hypothetical protein